MHINVFSLTRERKKNKKRDESDDEKEKNPKNKFKGKKYDKKKNLNNFKKKNKAYIGKWITDDETTEDSSSSDRDDEGHCWPCYWSIAPSSTKLGPLFKATTHQRRARRGARVGVMTADEGRGAMPRCDNAREGA